MKPDLRVWHRLYEGHLTDWPGRDERWVEDVRYLGNNRWEWRVESLNPTEPATKERLSTRALLTRVLDEDAYLSQGVESRFDEDVGDNDEPPPSFGPKTKALYSIAQAKGAQYCVECLERWLTGTWPTKARQPQIHILKILGTGTRQVWLHSKHQGIYVETNHGLAFLYPKITNDIAKVVLPPTPGPSARIYSVRVPRKLLGTVEVLAEALRYDRSARGASNGL